METEAASWTMPTMVPNEEMMDLRSRITHLTYEVEFLGLIIQVKYLEQDVRSLKHKLEIDQVTKTCY